MEIGQFVLQIVLARILAPEDYGVLSMMVFFTTLANVFNNGVCLPSDIKMTDEEQDRVIAIIKNPFA